METVNCGTCGELLDASTRTPILKLIRRKPYVPAVVTTVGRKCDVLKSGPMICPRYYFFPLASGNFKGNIWVILEKVDDIKPGNRDSLDQPSVVLAPGKMIVCNSRLVIGASVAPTTPTKCAESADSRALILPETATRKVLAVSLP